MKEDNDNNNVHNKQEITIPFEWEEKPGAPKKDFTPKRPVLPFSSPHLPAKYVASVPFKWEEKPGTPLRCFAKESKVDADIDELDKCLPLPPKYYANNRSSSYDYIYECDDSWMWDIEVSKTETNESSNTSQCSLLLLANGLTSNNKLDQQKVSEARVVGSFDEDIKVLGDNYDDNDRVNGVIRRPPTLGELIMLSRRRSFHRKEIHIRKRNQSEEKFVENKVKGCLNLGAYEGIARLRKNLLRLNLA